MVAIPTWLRGKDLTSVTITAKNVAAGGTVTNSSTNLLSGSATRTITGICKSVRASANFMTEDIRPVSSQQAHNVRTGLDSTISVTFLLATSGATLGSSPIAALLMAATDNEVVGLSFTRGGNSWAFIGTVESYEDGVDNFGQNTGTASFKVMDDAAGLVYG